MNIVLLGDPASGKATQAKRLARKYRLHDFDMGRETRSPWAKKLHDYKRTTGRGKLTPTWLVRQVLREVIARVPPSRGILFDGHPKMLGEAKIVANLLKKYKRANPLVIYLNIPFEEMVRRAARRGRKDDTKAALENRLRYYRYHLKRVSAFFGGRYVYKKISGLGTREEVFKRIVRCVESFRRTM